MSGSPQALPEPERRLVAAWAADCAERVLGLFEVEAPGDKRPRALIGRARAYAQGELSAAEGIRQRFTGGVRAGEARSAAAMAAARAAGQAAAVCHMGAHGLGAAAYAVEAVRVEDLTENSVRLATNWHRAREQRARELDEVEGAEQYALTQRILETAAVLTGERRLSRLAYLVHRP